MKFVFCIQINIKVLYMLVGSFWVCATRHAQSTQNKKFAYLFNISSKAWEMKLIFCLQINTKVLYKLIVSLWACLARHAQSTQNNKLTISQGKCEGWTWSFAYRLTPKVSSNCYYHFRCVCPSMLKLPKITSLLFLCNILRKNWVMKLIFCMQVSMKACYKLIVWEWSKIPKVPKIASLQCLYSISKKNLKLKLIFCMQSFQKVYFNTLSIKVAYKVDIIIINGHDQVFSNYIIGLSCHEQVCLSGLRF